MGRGVSVSIVMIFAMLTTVGFLALITSQASIMNNSWPVLADKFQGILNQAVFWVSSCFHISVQKINLSITNERAELLKNSGAAIGVTLTTMGGIMAVAILTPVYVFMILYYQLHLLEFVHKLFDAGNDVKLSEILAETKAIIHAYLRGLLIEFIIISVLNTLSLFILGIDYALLLGIAGALLNVIPLIGGAVGILLFIAVVAIAKAPIYILYITIMYTVIQFIDNHYIIPKVVGARVKLNALVCIIAVITADTLWGMPGMFLAIPLTAIIKLILDRIEPLKPWGFMLGDTVSTSSKMTFKFTIKGFIQGITTKHTTNDKY
jgi:predicted PurR-regulated permease PerM